MERIDLHIHTNVSDGAFNPFEIIDMAEENNVKIISITDHDTIAGYSDELFNYANLKNIKLVTGVEISTKYNGCGIHVLGYNIDIKNKKLNDELFKLRNARHDYLFEVSKKLNDLGYYVSVNELDKIDAVTKAHIASMIINDIKNKDLLIKNFGFIPDKGMFIETVMNEGCPCYVEKKNINPILAAKLIRDANGLVVLAHPVAYKYEDNMDYNEIVKLINLMNADGVEGNYLYIDRYNKLIDERNLWNNLAKELNITSTVGSDYHNNDKIRPMIGEVSIDHKNYDQIIEFLDI